MNKLYIYQTSLHFFFNQINSRELKENVQTPGHIGPVKTKKATQHKSEGIKILFFKFFYRLFSVFNFYPEPSDLSRQFYLELSDYYAETQFHHIKQPVYYHSHKYINITND